MANYNPIQTCAMPRSEKILNMIWGIVNSTLFRITPPTFGNQPQNARLNASCFWSKSLYVGQYPSFRKD